MNFSSKRDAQQYNFSYSWTVGLSSALTLKADELTPHLDLTSWHILYAMVGAGDSTMFLPI
jgi:hypothetical protein